MDETRPPPPTLPLRLVQPPNAALAALRAENGRLSAELTNKGHASSARIVGDRADNLLSTPRLDVETRIVPPAYGRDIRHTIGFINPAFSQT